MARNNRQLILLEEQTILSRERTMQQYMSTGLAFIALGVVMIQLLGKVPYNTYIGSLLVAIGFWQVWQAYLRHKRYRKLARKLRHREKKLGLEVGEED
jgi:uncharacterized membrane protein YidH (DUF202 family)